MFEAAMHHPKLHRVKTFPRDPATAGGFHTVELTRRRDSSDSARIVLYIDHDWAEWDDIVDAVNAYRAKRADR